MRAKVRLAAATALVGLLVLAGCAGGIAPGEPSAAPVPSTSGSPSDEAVPEPTLEPGPVSPAGDPTVLVTGLTSPWSIVRLSTGSALISERDTARIIEYSAPGTTRIAGTVEGVVHQGEGGLLGLAALETGDTRYLYAYYTSSSDNRIVRMPLLGAPGAYRLGAQEPILTGIAKSGNHNGGRIAFGPDGKLYATAGDAGQPNRAQDGNSLNGKILRLSPDGSVPSDNPFPGSPVYTLGHRNPQGLAWDANGQLWASEFGQNTWDELNRIVPGKDYGWPVVEGIAHDRRFVDPVAQWSTDEASPSGLAYAGGAFWMAGLGGQRLWRITISASGHASTRALFAGNAGYGRLRDVAAAPGGGLLVLTDNTDGRGTPRDGDDRLLHVPPEVLG
jgi:glucose/arabinose dehydrogenase